MMLGTHFKMAQNTHTHVCTELLSYSLLASNMAGSMSRLGLCKSFLLCQLVFCQSANRGYQRERHWQGTCSFLFCFLLQSVSPKQQFLTLAMTELFSVQAAGSSFHFFPQSQNQPHASSDIPVSAGRCFPCPSSVGLFTQDIVLLIPSSSPFSQPSGW